MTKSIHKKSDVQFSIIISLLCLLIWQLPTGLEKPELVEQTIRCRGEVLEVDNDDLKSVGVVTVGGQEVIVAIHSGKYKNDTVVAHNILQGQMKIDKVYHPGQKVYTLLRENKEKTQVQSARVDDIYRIHIEWILFLLFAVFLLWFAGWTGCKALISFVFSALSIWKILTPLLLKGYAPIPTTLAIVSVTTTVILLLVCGFTKKGIVALLGSLGGIIVTLLLSQIFHYLFQIPGTVHDYADALLYAGYQINLQEIFISCIFLSAAGAVMDIAMDIAAAQTEIVDQNPSISTKELTRSGFRVARPVIGTMTTTLLFAYSGSFMFVMMVFMTKGTPFELIANTNYIASELLQTLVGSFGLVLVAPTTAIIGGRVLKKKTQVSTKETMTRSRSA